MDEPCSALDPIATAKIEELIDELQGRTTPSSSSPIPCSRPRAYRRRPRSSISASWSRPGATEQDLHQAEDKRTQDYITGRFG